MPATGSPHRQLPPSCASQKAANRCMEKEHLFVEMARKQHQCITLDAGPSGIQMVVEVGTRYLHYLHDCRTYPHLPWPLGQQTTLQGTFRLAIVPWGRCHQVVGCSLRQGIQNPRSSYKQMDNTAALRLFEHWPFLASCSWLQNRRE